MCAIYAILVYDVKNVYQICYAMHVSDTKFYVFYVVIF